MEAFLRRPTEGRAHRPPEGAGVRAPSDTRKAPGNRSTRPHGAPVLVQKFRSYDSTSPRVTRRGPTPQRGNTIGAGISPVPARGGTRESVQAALPQRDAPSLRAGERVLRDGPLSFWESPVPARGGTR